MSNDWGFGWDADAPRGAGESLDLEATAVLGHTLCKPLYRTVCLHRTVCY